MQRRDGMTVYAAPGQSGSVVTYAGRYDNIIGGKWVPPVQGRQLSAEGDPPCRRELADPACTDGR